jgi:hypothetical protein
MSCVSGFAPAKTYCPGQLITFRGWPHKIIPEELPNLGGIVFSANRFYQQPAEFSVPVLQLSYNDKAGRFPWGPATLRRRCSRDQTHSARGSQPET